MRRFTSFVLVVLFAAGVAHGQWVQQPTPTTSSLTDLALLDSLTAIAVGDNGSILRTTDAGLNWKALPAYPLVRHPLNAVSFFDNHFGCAVGTDGQIGISTDGGVDWIWSVTSLERTNLSVLVRSPASLYVGADSGWIFHSMDSGKTWNSERIGNGPIRSIFMWRGVYTMSPALYALSETVLSTRTEFPSTPWIGMSLSAFLGLGSAAHRGDLAVGGGPGYIVGVQGDLRAAPAIVRKRITDTTWTNATVGVVGDGEFLGVAAPSELVAYVCGTNGLMFKSTTGGDTWIGMKVPTMRTLHSIRFLNELFGIAVGDSGTILCTTNGGITGVDERTSGLPASFGLGQNYPNPFNPGTIIRYTLARTAFVNLTVYDILGREIAVLVNGEQETGNREIRFDGSALPTGVYVVRMEAGHFRASRKILLLR